MARRFNIHFSVESLERVGAEGPPLAGGEPLLGLRIRHPGIEFTVRSGGCTRKRDFAVDVEDAAPLQLRLVRLRPDPCTAVRPLGAAIRFSWRELGIRPGETFHVVNPLADLEVPRGRGLPWRRPPDAD